MGRMTVSTHIAAPQQEVFALLADLEGAADRIEAIQKIELLTDGPVGKGTRWRETRRVFKREATEELEISAFDPPNGYDVTCESCGCTFTTRIRCTPEGGGATVTMSMQSKANTFVAKLMRPLGFLMAGAMKKCVAKDLEELKRHAEGGTAGEA